MTSKAFIGFGWVNTTIHWFLNNLQDVLFAISEYHTNSIRAAILYPMACCKCEDKILGVFDRIAPLSKHGEPVRAA